MRNRERIPEVMGYRAGELGEGRGAMVTFYISMKVGTWGHVTACFTSEDARAFAANLIAAADLAESAPPPGVAESPLE